MFGSVTLSRLAQSAKALPNIVSPLVITKLINSSLGIPFIASYGIVAFLIWQPLNAFSAILVTLLGIVILVI